MFGLDLKTILSIGLIALGGIGFLWQNRAAIKPWLSFGGSSTVDDDAADFQALTRLQKRYARLNCPEGKAAVQVCLTHFYHEA